jgi:hypothetical protein
VGRKYLKAEEGPQNMGKIFEIPISPKNGRSTAARSSPTKNGRNKYQPRHDEKRNKTS